MRYSPRIPLLISITAAGAEKNYCHKPLRITLLYAKEANDEEELQAFLTYLTSGTPETDLKKRLDHQVKRARSHIEWRKEYMTLLERDERMREEGRKEGREEERANTLREKARADEEKARADEEKARADEIEKKLAILEKQLSELRSR